MENKITKCVSCGAELTEGAKFCEKCGHAVEQKKRCRTEKRCRTVLQCLRRKN